jgi:hypothetical protein
MSPESALCAEADATPFRRIRVCYPQDLMEVTAEPPREECLKGFLNGEAVFALVRGQVSPGDERIDRASVTRTGSHLDSLSWCRAPPVGDRDEPLARFTAALRVQLSWGRERACLLTRALSRFAKFHCGISQHMDAKTSLSRPDFKSDWFSSGGGDGSSTNFPQVSDQST